MSTSDHFPGLDEWKDRVGAHASLEGWRAGMRPRFERHGEPLEQATYTLVSPPWDWSDRGIDVREVVTYTGHDPDVLIAAAEAKALTRRITT